MNNAEEEDQVRWLDEDLIESIDLIIMEFPGGSSVELDPYFHYAPESWNELSRNDGHTYGGIEEIVHRKSGELYKDFYERVCARASELNLV